MKNFILIKLAIVTFGLSQPYDIVIKQGRVIDPETDLDQICNICLIGNQISDITNNSINGKIAINAKGCTGYTRKQLDKLTDWVKRPQIGAKGMIYVKCNEDGSYKSSVDKFFGQEDLAAWANATEANPGD